MGRDKLRRFIVAIILAWGWKRVALALAAGALSALAMPPFNAWPILFVTFPVVLWLIDGSGAGRLRGVPAAAMAGWWFGLGYFVPGLYWLGYAFLVDASTFAWLMPFALLVAMGIFGGVSLSLHPTAMLTEVKLRIMQPNLQQDVKFNYSAKAEVMKKYLTLSDRASGPQSTGVRDTSILIWPESAFPFFLTREADAMAQIADLLPKGTVLIAGSVRAPDLPAGTRITRAYNSIYVIDHDGSVV